MYFYFLRKFPYENCENNENFRVNFRENTKKLDFFLKKLESTLTLGLWKRSFFFHLFINSSHFDRPCKDGPGEPGPDIQDRTVSEGFRGQDMLDNTDWSGQ